MEYRGCENIPADVCLIYHAVWKKGLKRLGLPASLRRIKTPTAVFYPEASVPKNFCAACENYLLFVAAAGGLMTEPETSSRSTSTPVCVDGPSRQQSSQTNAYKRRTAHRPADRCTQIAHKNCSDVALIPSKGELVS